MNNFFIDIVPGNQTWDQWSGSVIHITNQDNLPIVPEAQWPDFARRMQNTPEMSAFGLPDPDGFTSWQGWANNLTLVTNGNFLN